MLLSRLDDLHTWKYILPIGEKVLPRRREVIWMGPYEEPTTPTRTYTSTMTTTKYRGLRWTDRTDILDSEPLIEEWLYIYTVLTPHPFLLRLPVQLFPNSYPTSKSDHSIQRSSNLNAIPLHGTSWNIIPSHHSIHPIPSSFSTIKGPFEILKKWEKIQ